MISSVLYKNICDRKDIKGIILLPHENSLRNRKAVEEMAGCSLVYMLFLELNRNGLKNLLIQAVESFGTVEECKSGFSKATKLAATGYKDGHCTAVYFYQTSDLANIKKIPGTVLMEHEETVIIAAAVLFPNSVVFLNHGKLGFDKELFFNIIKFRNLVKNSGQLLNDYLVDSSSIMGLYGLRRVNDLDFLTTVSDSGLNAIEGISNHWKEAAYYQMDIKKLVYDPKNFLYFMGVKFITLDLCRKFKENRNQRKDIRDVFCINYFSMQKKQRTLQMKWCHFKVMIFIWLKDTFRTLKKQLSNARWFSIPKKIIYTLLRTMYSERGKGNE